MLSFAAFSLLVGMTMAQSVENCTRRLRVAMIRHGESMNNVHEAIGAASYRAHRSADPDLSPRGYEQARLLGEWLSSPSKRSSLGLSEVTEVWVSPVRRTMLTAKPLSSAFASPKVVTDIFEAGGIYDSNPDYTEFVGRGGLTLSEMSQEFPNYVVEGGVGEDGWYRGSGRESEDECRERAARVAERLRNRAKTLTDQQTLILVVHYDFINALIDAMVRPDTRGPFDRWKLYNTGISVVDIDQSSLNTSFIAVNAVPHILQQQVDDSAELLSGFPI